jgi:hypothetical protein
MFQRLVVKDIKGRLKEIKDQGTTKYFSGQQRKQTVEILSLKVKQVLLLLTSSKVMIKRAKLTTNSSSTTGCCNINSYSSFGAKKKSCLKAKTRTRFVFTFCKNKCQNGAFLESVT